MFLVIFSTTLLPITIAPLDVSISSTLFSDLWPALLFNIFYYPKSKDSLISIFSFQATDLITFSLCINPSCPYPYCQNVYSMIYNCNYWLIPLLSWSKCVYPTPKFIYWNLILNVIILFAGAMGSWFGYEGSTLRKLKGASCPFPFTM
jgi:hypothetical protein